MFQGCFGQSADLSTHVAKWGGVWYSHLYSTFEHRHRIYMRWGCHLESLSKYIMILSLLLLIISLKKWITSQNFIYVPDLMFLFFSYGQQTINGWWEFCYQIYWYKYRASQFIIMVIFEIFNKVTARYYYKNSRIALSFKIFTMQCHDCN